MNSQSDSVQFLIGPGGVTSASGFRAATLLAGIKPSRKRDDMTLIVSDVPATAAGVFTSNRVVAAPVRLCRRHLADQLAQAILINAGNANACTGAQGMADAENSALWVGQQLGIDPTRVLICSTGTIGIPMPMEKIEAHLPRLIAGLTRPADEAAAHAIMTTDTVPKHGQVQFTIDGKTVTIGGMAKGAGMIEPHMATLLCFLTSDAQVEPEALRLALKDAADLTFNRITIDGDQSTNDTVLMLANGHAQNRPLNPHHPEWSVFCRALTALMKDLALRIVRDGEGATRFVTVTVQGAPTPADADKAARAVCRSLLVKTSWFGGDPNWGRIMDAIGYSGAELDEHAVEIRFDNLVAVRNGRFAEGASLEELAKVYAQPAFSVTIDLHRGTAATTLYTCDCSEAYVRINAEYMT